MLQDVEDRRRQHIAAEDRIVRQLFAQRRLFVHIADAVDALGELFLQLHGGILDDELVRDLAHRDGAAFVCLCGRDQLLEDGRFAEHDVVAEQDRERLVAHKALGTPDRVAEALRLLLAEEEHIRHVRDLADDPRVVRLAVQDQPLLEVGGVIEIVFDRAFAAVGDDQDLLDAGGDRFLDDVLDDGLVNQGQHLLGDALRVGQQSRPESCGRNDGFSDFHALLLPPPGKGEFYF